MNNENDNWSTAVVQASLWELKQSRICLNPMPFPITFFFARPSVRPFVPIFSVLADNYLFLYFWMRTMSVATSCTRHQLRGPHDVLFVYSFRLGYCRSVVVFYISAALVASSSSSSCLYSLRYTRRVLCKSSMMPLSSRGFSPRVDERC